MTPKPDGVSGTGQRASLRRKPRSEGRAERWEPSSHRAPIWVVGAAAGQGGTSRAVQRQWAVAKRAEDGSLPSALTPLSVDGMIVAASAMLLADSRSGDRSGVLGILCESCFTPSLRHLRLYPSSRRAWRGWSRCRGARVLGNARE
jgi:hypothetical protein